MLVRIIVVLLASIAVGAVAAPSYAHPKLAAAEPNTGAVVSSSPTEVSSSNFHISN
jgi:hypothetical protein